MKQSWPQLRLVLTAGTLLLTLVCLEGYASECNALSSSKVERLQASLSSSVENLSQLQRSLLEETKVELSRGAVAASDKLHSESDLVDSVIQDSERVDRLLDRVLVLVQVREVMVNERDRQNVGKFLDISMGPISAQSNRGTESINRRLVRIERPAVAAEVAKVRDAIGHIGAIFEPCKTNSVR